MNAVGSSRACRWLGTLLGFVLVVLHGDALASARGSSLEAYEQELGAAQELYTDACGNISATLYADGPSSTVAVAESLNRRLASQSTRIDRELGTYLRFLENPEAELPSYYNRRIGTAQAELVQEQDELDGLYHRLHRTSEARLAAKRARVGEIRSGLQRLTHDARDPEAFHSFKAEQIRLAQERVAGLNRLGVRVNALQRRTQSCLATATGNARFAEHPRGHYNRAIRDTQEYQDYDPFQDSAAGPVDTAEEVVPAARPANGGSGAL
ncbi:MAG: hypothetical protein IT285_07000 [Bdellovibrionales bacterium]|nr:hypothetical protein [Bdellovibrionales bacterium]